MFSASPRPPLSVPSRCRPISPTAKSKHTKRILLIGLYGKAGRSPAFPYHSQRGCFYTRRGDFLTSKRPSQSDGFHSGGVGGARTHDLSRVRKYIDYPENLHHICIFSNFSLAYCNSFATYKQSTLLFYNTNR